jgi:hypothetical protein
MGLLEMGVGLGGKTIFETAAVDVEKRGARPMLLDD